VTDGLGADFVLLAGDELVAVLLRDFLEGHELGLGEAGLWVVLVFQLAADELRVALVRLLALLGGMHYYYRLSG
jgi:hypothetical protein